MNYIPMSALTSSDYKNFVSAHNEIVIEDVKIPIGKHLKVKRLQPESFEMETNTVWSFPKRGDWATHYRNAKYRGNWAPQVPRNLILRYSKKGETVLDAFAGSGTTLIECKLLGRNGIGVDINKEAVMVTRDRLNFSSIDADFPSSTQKTYLGDARNLNLIKKESIDLIATHPPYASIIPYTKNSNHKQEGDLSEVHSINEFAEEMKNVAHEFQRILRPGGYCAVLMGDTRRHKHQVPISFRVMQSFMEEDFILKESIIKVQHHTKTAPLWKNMSVKFNFLLLMHEHLFVFRKPENGEKLNKFKESMRWW
ncbi:MAG: RsmD family RNA methyltransferase [Thermoplasmatales archaeon]|nr:RsmD family RNA methyltransferase [Thermoplasmatales archaeon]